MLPILWLRATPSVPLLKSRPAGTKLLPIKWEGAQPKVLRHPERLAHPYWTTDPNGCLWRVQGMLQPEPDIEVLLCYWGSWSSATTMLEFYVTAGDWVEADRGILWGVTPEWFAERPTCYDLLGLARCTRDHDAPCTHPRAVPSCPAAARVEAQGRRRDPTLQEA